MDKNRPRFGKRAPVPGYPAPLPSYLTLPAAPEQPAAREQELKLKGTPLAILLGYQE